MADVKLDTEQAGKIARHLDTTQEVVEKLYAEALAAPVPDLVNVLLNMLAEDSAALKARVRDAEDRS